MTRSYTRIEKQHVEPIEVPAGRYLTLSDYAKTQGMHRLTAYTRMKRAWALMPHWQRKVWALAGRKARG